MYTYTKYKTPCSSCKEPDKVIWQSFDDDCRGNPGYAQIMCLACNKHFTPAEWREIASAEIESKYK